MTPDIHTLLPYSLPERYHHARLTDFPDATREQITGSSFIHGPVGTGKTHLLAAIMCDHAEKRLQRRRPTPISAEYTTLPELMMQIRSTMNPGSRITEQDIIIRYGKAFDLFLDDIGAEKTTDYSRSVLYLLIEKRSNAKAKTYITSNLTLNEIASIHGQRIASRIAGMCKVIKLTGKDRRLQ